MARILLLEDDADQLELRAMALQRLGHEVIKAASAPEAISSGCDCDVLIADLLPGAEELLASVPQSTAVIVLSGRDQVSEAVARRSAAVLRKPCRSATLMEAITRALWTSPSK